MLLGLVLDWVFGDPPALWRRIPHPVALIGRGLDRLAAYRLSGVTSMIDIIQGAVALALMLGLVLAIVLGLVWLLREALMVALGDDRSWMFAWVWLLVEALLIWPWLAWHSLFYHVRAVADGLDQAGSEQASLEQADLEQANLEQARLKDGQAALAHIVGRDVTRLDKEGVARAACESLAENYSDGVLAPIFWYLVGGLPGLVLYKAVNTADSMWGYRSQSWLYFGRIA
ncbi:MAG: CobD/CbiB family cobalamin biosynthesis protein, partial [Pseudomonadota bacterium]